MAGNFVTAKTERKTNESGGLFPSMMIHFPTILLVVVLSTTLTHIDRQEYRVVKYQWGVKVGTGVSIFSPEAIK